MKGEQMSVLVVVAGHAGAGKERFADILARRTGAKLVRASADPVGAAVDGAAPLDPEGYGRLLRSARASLESGSLVVVVAPFETSASRGQLMKLSAELRCALLYVECSANEVVRRRRLRQRLRASQVADVDTRVEEAFAVDGRFEPVLREVPRACQMLVDTTVGIEIWAGLAAGRIETYMASTPADGDSAKAISAG